jgi:hypothetical protein
MPVPVKVRFLSGVLCRVAVQTLREAMTTAKLLFAMLRALYAWVESLRTDVVRVAAGGSTSSTLGWAAE